jgi:hypothetical protein
VVPERLERVDAFRRVVQHVDRPQPRDGVREPVVPVLEQVAQDDRQHDLGTERPGVGPHARPEPRFRAAHHRDGSGEHEDLAEARPHHRVRERVAHVVPELRVAGLEPVGPIRKHALCPGRDREAADHESEQQQRQQRVVGAERETDPEDENGPSVHEDGVEEPLGDGGGRVRHAHSDG